MTIRPHTDGHGPLWAAAVADLADRAASAFASAGNHGCFTVIDMQPWRRLDAWWLRRSLEPLARLSGRAMRYVPCEGPAPLEPAGREEVSIAPAWSVGDAPLQLRWAAGTPRPLAKETGRRWTPDGPVLVLAGGIAARLPQQLLLAHHGRVSEWRGEPGKKQWEPVDFACHRAWIAESLRGYAKGLPSAMFSLPIGYWRLVEKAISWASEGCIVVARAEGWSSLAAIRETSAARGEVRADSPPVNFHWLAQHLPRLRAKVRTLAAGDGEIVQLSVTGLPDADAAVATLSAPLAAATRSARTDRARAVRALAAGCDLDTAVSVLEQSAHDPVLLRGAWDALARAAAQASPASSARLGAWVERVMADNPWIGDDAELLRGAGQVAMACARTDIAQTALEALDESGYAVAADLAALARCETRLGRFDAALAVCDRALALQPRHADSLAARESVLARKGSLAEPWRIQCGADEALVRLDPLHADHAPTLARQMRDPTICTMTALPAPTKEDDGRQWIQARLADGVAAYAIMHRRLGFVGYLDMRVWESTAFVCYWVGPDFQGLGLCTPALALACEIARRNGVELMLSSAYDDNARSLRVLANCGFRPMDIRAAAPDADRTFVMLPTRPMDAEEASRRLIEFCDNTASGLRFATEASSGDLHESE
ncbi:MAG TPA: GNAT family N-acetyltransferase [Ramlibacter sp.]|uniref:GNAT family N-acetyltransferase n=1 Tax=Ramlibacter sp. TaxID=1917967 RepID=UPI002B6BA918|nr:GNAT family N-acetyltransferase [Ramlibacter sp.]HVZ45031.1 GNAT family N-acetyltransferase [Ramlibacter sp.]